MSTSFVSVHRPAGPPTFSWPSPTMSSASCSATGSLRWPTCSTNCEVPFSRALFCRDWFGRMGACLMASVSLSWYADMMNFQAVEWKMLVLGVSRKINITNSGAAASRCHTHAVPRIQEIDVMCSAVAASVKRGSVARGSRTRARLWAGRTFRQSTGLAHVAGGVTCA